MYKKWLKFGAILKEVLTAITFFALFPALLFTLYHMFFDVDMGCVLVGDVTSMMLFFVNSHL